METRGPIYDYDQQRWTDIDTDRDEQTGAFTYVTPDGVAYELNPDDPTEYRNYASRSNCITCGTEFIASAILRDGLCSGCTVPTV